MLYVTQGHEFFYVLTCYITTITFAPPVRYALLNFKALNPARAKITSLIRGTKYKHLSSQCTSRLLFRWRGTGSRWWTEGASFPLSRKTLFLSLIRYKHDHQRKIAVLSVHKSVAFPSNRCLAAGGALKLALSFLLIFLSPSHLFSPSLSSSFTSTIHNKALQTRSPLPKFSTNSISLPPSSRQ